MKPGDFEIHAPKEIESFKYSYLHTLKVKRGKKGELQKPSTKTRIETNVNISRMFPISWGYQPHAYHLL
jgi:hypothetical protein